MRAPSFSGDLQHRLPRPKIRVCPSPLFVRNRSLSAEFGVSGRSCCRRSGRDPPAPKRDKPQIVPNCCCGRSRVLSRVARVGWFLILGPESCLRGVVRHRYEGGISVIGVIIGLSVVGVCLLLDREIASGLVWGSEPKRPILVDTYNRFTKNCRHRPTFCQHFSESPGATFQRLFGNCWTTWELAWTAGGGSFVGRVGSKCSTTMQSREHDYPCFVHVLVFGVLCTCLASPLALLWACCSSLTPERKYAPESSQSSMLRLPGASRS